MTRDEFLRYRNASGKIHPEHAYDFDLSKLNQDYSLQPIVNTDINNRSVRIEGNTKGYLIRIDGKLLAVVHGDTAYADLRLPPRFFPFRHRTIRDRDIEIVPPQIKKVKYIADYVPLVSDVAKKNRSENPTVMRRLEIGGNRFEMRTASEYRPNSGATIVVLNEEGLVVAQASDEWGTTLLAVAQEYRGYGLGRVMGKVWYDLNTKYMSGGFTPQGMRNALAIWSDRVREMLSDGSYSRLVRAGEVSLDRVQEIVRSIGERPKARESEQKHKPSPLVFSDGSMFVVYDRRFLDEQDEKFVYAHGFLRNDPSGDLYYFTLDYDKPFKRIATYVAFQMVRDQNEDLLVRSPPSDHIELDGFDDIEVDGDYAKLTKDRLDLKMFGDLEKALRTKHDPYGEVYQSLLEIANTKWD